MDDNYEQIVTDFSSPNCVLAGPGAGKTYLLADSVTRLLKNDVDKNQVTVLAYTKDASMRMKNELIDPKKPWKLDYNQLPQIRTLHSLGLEVVNRKPDDVESNNDNLQTQKDDKVKKLMYRDAALILDFNKNDSKDAFECKQHGDCKPNINGRKCRICGKYWEIMSKCNRIDFDDQILFACEILEQNPELLKEYQSKARYLLVDEYQDINAAQFRLIKLLSENSLNGLLVVGDDAQTIYKFRGADPKFILMFDSTFPGAKTRPLPYNHRCPKEIMDDAFKILNKFYPEYKGIKKIEELTFYTKAGKPPYVWQLSSEFEEAQEAAKIASESLRDEKDVLILVPKKEFFQLVINELRRRGVPYDCQENFLPERMNTTQRFINWVEQPNDSFRTRLVVEELINKGIAKVKGAKKRRTDTLETRQRRTAEETKIAKLWESVDNEHDLFFVIQNLKDSDGTLAIIRDNLNNLINSYNVSEQDNSGEFIKQLYFMSKIWTDPSKFTEDLSSVHKLLKPQELSLSRLVRLRTMRKAKGLQAEVVIIIGLEKGIVPYPGPGADLAEEARLFYVSMTRAKERLYLLHSWRRSPDITYDKIHITNRERSQFLDVLGRESQNPKWQKKTSY